MLSDKKETNQNYLRNRFCFSCIDKNIGEIFVKVNLKAKYPDLKECCSYTIEERSRHFFALTFEKRKKISTMSNIFKGWKVEMEEYPTLAKIKELKKNNMLQYHNITNEKSNLDGLANNLHTESQRINDKLIEDDDSSDEIDRNHEELVVDILKLKTLSPKLELKPQPRHRAVTQIRTDDYRLYLQWGRYLALQGEPVAAMQKYEEGRHLDPRNPLIYFEWGNIHKEQENYEEAEKKYLIAKEMDPYDIRIYLHLGEIFVIRQFYDRLEDILDAVKRIFPFGDDILMQIERVLEKKGQNLETLELLRTYRKLSEIHKNDPRILLKMGERLEMQGKYSEAEKFYLKAVEKYRDDPDAFDKVGQHFLVQGNYILSESIYRRALEIFPENLEFLIKLESILYEQSKSSEAEQFSLKIVEKCHDDPYVFEAVGQQFLMQGKYNLSGRVYRKALEIFPQKPHFLLKFGAILHELNQGSEVENLDLKAVEEYSSDVFDIVGQHFLMLGKYTLAEYVYRKALEIFPQKPHFLLKFGAILQQQNREPEAEQAYLKAIEENPDDLQVFIEVGDRFFRQGKYHLSERVYRKALLAFPENLKLVVRVGAISQKQNKDSEAEQFYLKAIEECRDGSIELQFPRKEKYDLPELVMQLKAILNEKYKDLGVELIFLKALEENLNG